LSDLRRQRQGGGGGGMLGPRPRAGGRMRPQQRPRRRP